MTAHTRTRCLGNMLCYARGIVVGQHSAKLGRFMLVLLVAEARTMKKQPIILLVCICFSVLGFSGEGQAKPAPSPKHHPVYQKHHLIYQLMFVPVGMTKPMTRLPKCVWRVDTARKPGPVYKSLHEPGLLLWVSHLPKGTEIQYVMLPYPTATDPEEGVPALAHLCRSRGVIFNYSPMM